MIEVNSAFNVTPVKFASRIHGKFSKSPPHSSLLVPITKDRGMVCFKSFEEGSMTILSNPADKVENGTTLPWVVETDCEVIGGKSDSEALLLQSAHHDEETDPPTPFSLFGHKIQNKTVVWGNTFKAIADPPYCEGYWEWLEDILSHHEQMLKQKKIYDAIYSSLFSYDRLGSVMRCFFVPSVDELIGVDKDNSYHLPVNCRYLFFAYHRLLTDSKKGEVKIDAWVKFWFGGGGGGGISYFKSAKKTSRNKTQRPAKVNNPSGSIGLVQA
ncbi:hypothetical protein Vadar_018753 [Vaccinium darrowii]|uniref:Uncharacterized protein n=1 Tax=Vaccinium darrowii TaxID=229202 RepID=A0ACB7YEI8_9ERIC|nr:hypothetical protein Vadar_018753 [Vaccinium darrowii]